MRGTRWIAPLRWRRACAAACAVAVAAAAACRPSGAQGADSAAAAAAAAAVRALAVSSVEEEPGTPATDEALLMFYAHRDWTPAWIADGRVTPQASAVVDFLSDAGVVGLEADDYDAQRLVEWRDRLAARPPGLTEGARFDVSLSRALLLLLGDLSRGRVEPVSLGFSLPPKDDVDLAAVARDVSQADDVSATIRDVEPRYAGYQALERALGTYRTLAADSALGPPRRARTPVRPGDSYADMAALRRLLVAFGDLTADTTSAPDALVYTPDEVAAIERFQARHGLESDGIIGPATFAALRVPIARRVEQIELTLERWRWLPRRPPSRYVAINIPAFRLFAFENDSTAAHPVLSMKVILGATQTRHATPVFEGSMRDVVFRPYWDVPRSIATRELIPLLRPDTGYALHQSLEIVRGSDARATVYPITARTLDLVASGTLRLRQRPGPDNALGLVKFVFPNAHGVYLHGTPATELFAYARRAFSHGCIRVEHPVALAAFALGDARAWTDSAIVSAMHGDRPRTVPLVRPVEVFILYGTAVADSAGIVSFYPDLYGHDAALARALARERARLAQRSRSFAEDP